MTTNTISTTSMTFTTGPRSGGRLIILVPMDTTYGTTTKRIWQLGVATGKQVQLLSLCKDSLEEFSLRRQLILMSALVGEMGIRTEVKVETGMNWVEAVRRNYQPGDTIVCFAEHRNGVLQNPLKQILEGSLDAPIYIFSSLDMQKHSSSRWVSRAILWAGWIGILAGFFLLQSRISLLPNGFTETTLLILAVIFEFWLIWVWNNRFS